jgi:serine/threonine protein kinase
MIPPPSALPPGTVLDGRFVVRRRLGAGGFGTVYLADQRVFDLTLRQVALKLFHRDLITETNAREHLNDAVVLMRFQEETHHREASRHLITVLDAGFLRDSPGQAFVAMEYVPGYQLPGSGTARTLQDMITAFRPVPVHMALGWMTQILRAVAWMHTLEPPVLHCDLKADNVIPDRLGTLKVADFGLAQLAFGAIGLHGGAGAIICQAPETLAGVEPTPASDVYSLGLLLHEMLAGESPLAMAGLAETAAGDSDGYLSLQLEARQAGIAPLTVAANPDLTRHPLVIEIVGKCLRFRATQRYANAAMLLRDIEAYTSGKGDPAVFAPVVAGPDVAPELERLIAEADALRRQGRTAEGLDRAKAALARYPEAVAAYACLARMRLTAHHWKTAVELCGTALALDSLSKADRAMLYELSAGAYDAGGMSALAVKMRDRAAAARKADRG